jgi:oligoendopeptidase F
MLHTEWQLSCFYTDLEDAQIEIDIAIIKNKTSKITSNINVLFKENLSHIQFGEVLADYEELNNLISKPLFFLHLFTVKYTQNQEGLKKLKEFEHLLTWISAELTVFDELCKQIGADRLTKFANSAELSKYKHYLLTLAKNLRYQLTQAEEKILIKTSQEGVEAFKALTDEIRGSFEYKFTFQGVEYDLTSSQLSQWRTGTDSDKRREAFVQSTKPYQVKQTQILFGNAYSAVVKNWTNSVELRKYSSVMSPRNVSEELEDEFVDSMIEVVSNEFTLYHRFLEAKRNYLQVEKLHYSDLYAPFGEVKGEYAFEDSVTLLKSICTTVGGDAIGYLETMLQNGMMDVYPNKEKRGGAFVMSSGKVGPFMMLNHVDNFDSLSTFAHEFGHAYHAFLSQDIHSFDSNAPLVLCETASTFFENLLAKRLYNTLDDNSKLSLLGNQLDDFFATTMRQIMYATFEKTVHNVVSEGKTLSYKDLNRIWLSLVKKLVGSSVEMDEAQVEATWMGITHIFESPFYVYSYAFGNLLTMAFSQSMKLDEAGFVTKFKEFLSLGGSQTVEELLSIFDMTLTNPEFISLGLKEVEQKLEEFELLLLRK